MTDLVRNGWFINSNHVVFAVINGSLYQVDASDTPLPQLPPGSYSEAEATEALGEIEEQAALNERASTEKTIVDRRHAIVTYLDAMFQPVAKSRAIMMLARYTDRRGGAELVKFDPSQPRDEQGRWTDGGGGDGGGVAAPAAPGAAEPAKPSSGAELRPRLRGSMATKQRVEKWHAQILARQTELEKQGKIGTSEDSNLTQMNNALSTYFKADQGIDTLPGRGFNFQYDVDYDEGDAPELFAAVATRLDSETKVMDITYAGAISNEDLTAVLQDTVIRGQSEGAKRIEDQVFSDDEERIKAYEDAGFSRGGEGAGVTTMFWGEYVTPEERQVYERREQERKVRESGRVMDVATSVAKDLDFDANKIYIAYNDDPDVNFTLNGKEYKAAGLAYTVNPDPAIQGTIKLFPEQISAYGDAAQRVTAHEIQHIKFQNAIDEFRSQERALIEATRGKPIKDIFTASGKLKPPYDEQYPAFNVMDQAFRRYEANDFAKTDGVSNYSREYWKQFDKDPSSYNAYRSAMHETLAEMAAAKYSTGSFPDHFGPVVTTAQEYAQTRPTEAELAVGRDRWRNLYNAVEKVYQMGLSR